MDVHAPKIRSRAARALAMLCLCISAWAAPAMAQDNVFIYSTGSQIRGLNLTRGLDVPLTTSPIAAAANSLGLNREAGYAYYGDDTSVYRWDPALGSGANAHSLMMNFATGPVTAPITDLDSAGGSYVNGVYYVGSENPATGEILEIYALGISMDGTQVVSATALGLLSACACTSTDLGGFGDIAAVEEGGQVAIYGSSSGLGNGGGAQSGRWRFVPATNSFTVLASAANGQLSNSVTNLLYSNVGNDIRQVDKITGATSPVTEFTTSGPIFDFSGGYVIDFGDAPDSYGAAFHRQSASGFFIGANGPDVDPGSLNSIAGFVNGAGDDLDGIDDEDAIGTAGVVSVASDSYSVTVDCTAGTRVAAWIDFDTNGRFDTVERNDNHPVSCVAGSASLEWNGLPPASGGNSYIRLRASSNLAAISSPTGVASDGEVEDHPIVIDAPSSGSCPVGSQSTLYTPNDLPLAIPIGTANASSTLTVSDDVVITDVNVVDLQGTHTWINDLQFTLSHGGVSRVLYGYACGNQNDFSLSLNDESSGSPPCPPIDGGTYPPVQSLDAFDGQSSSGNWVLSVNDRFVNADGGAVNSWSLEICSAAAIDFSPEIRLGKAALVNGREVTVTLVAENVGDVALESIQVSDDLNAVFGAGNYSIVSAPEVLTGPAGLTVNPAWTGAPPNVDLLAGSGSLAIGERVELRFTVRVDSFAAAPSGEYSNSASATAVEIGGGEAVSDVSNNGLDLSGDADVPTPILVDASAVLSGRVFLDTSANASLAHDGLIASGEPAQGGRVVDALDAAGVVIASAITDADGDWNLQIPPALAAGSVSLVLRAANGSISVSEAPTYTTGTVSDGVMVLTPGVGAELTGLDFGVIEASRLDADRQTSVADGSVVVLPHVYTASTHGDLTVTAQARNSAPGVLRVLRDLGCDGSIDAADSEFTASLGVAAGEVVCLLLEVEMPAGTQAGLAFAYDITADLSVADVAGTRHNLMVGVTNRDTVTVLSAGAGRLELDKAVANLTRNESASVSNSALPGDTLEFVLTYSNSGIAELDGLSVNDAAPAHTSVVPGSAVCSAVPAGMTCSASVSADLVEWVFTGNLPPGQSGELRYQVTVD